MYGPVFLPATPHAIEHLAVGMSAPTARQNHAMILFRSTKKTLQILELIIDVDWHANVVARDYDPQERLAWAVPQLPPRVLRNIARDCEQIATKPVRTYYGFRFYKITALQNSSGTWSITGAIGLTCATLVLAMFNKNGFPLVDVDDWRADADDAQWQSKFADRIEREFAAMGVLGHTLTADEREYLEQNRADIPCTRFRPEDVIASCRCDAHPSKFDASRVAGAEVSSWIRKVPGQQ